MHHYQGERLCPLLKKPAVKQLFFVVNTVVAYCKNYYKFNKSQLVHLIFKASATVFFSLFIPAVLKAHLSITLMYINSQNKAVRSSISYYSFRYFIVVSFRLNCVNETTIK